MESKGAQAMRKRVKPTVEETEVSEPIEEDEAVNEIAEEETEINPVVSEQMELDIGHILEKINSFTLLVSELLESGKSLLKELSNEFEERLILIHKERIDKWQEEIKELHVLDASNEDVNALLHSARYLLQNFHTDS
ncbi:General transcription factor IIH subunit like [Actinidia chinensis var. chinensis]|uniref:General transcription factor IIH subunit like n=1 Tax=Actinidia chinensis var. chinensis TaxID=1590841 RepID=A0A2R6QDT1_ACTCC|nr:General transcription factor IIH subunit like [Actinidia chinensis var. chinensis]